jgi:hypothetical protein
VNVDRTLRALILASELRARNAKPREARRAIDAYSALAQLRRDAQCSAEVRSTIEKLRIVYRALAPKPAQHREKPGRPAAFTDVQYEAAARKHPTTKGIANELGCTRSAIDRYRRRVAAKS